MAQTSDADALQPTEPEEPISSAAQARDPRRWWALIGTCFGLFMALLDVTIVNVALPTIGNDLKASFSDLQWVVNAYSLTLAVLIVTAGRLGDLFGRKRLFMIGLGIFSLGSLLCALSGDISIASLSHIQVLLGARAIQGIGGSIMLPLALAIIAATFQGRERGVAIGLYGGVTGLATAIGPVIGGVLVENVSWQSIFYLNVPIGFIGIALCVWAVRESYDTSAPRSIDFFGLATLSVSLFCLVLALIQGSDPDKGWTSPYILTLFGIAALAMLTFIIGELRLKYPMVDLRLFKNVSFTGSAIIAFTVSAGTFALIFFLTLYLQNYLGFSALDGGLRLLPFSLLLMLAAPLAGLLTERLGARVILTAGMLILVASALLMARISPSDTPDDWIVLLPAFLLGGLGSGLVSPLISTVAVGTVSRDKSGMASGISGVCRQVGIAFGVAFLGAILTNQYNSALKSNVSALSIAHVPPAAQQSILDKIITALQNAGTFVGSTGLKHLPPQFAPFTQQPHFQTLFPQVQTIVQVAFINGTIDIFYVASGLLGVGVLAALLLVRKKDMQQAVPASERVLEIA